MLDVTRLRVLAAVAKYGSVTAAARALNYAQPSVSHHLARLEAETGTALVQRSGRGIQLTDAGRLLAGRAEEILGRLDAAEQELAAHVGQREERIRLAGFPSALATVVPMAAAWLRAEHPGVELLLTEAEPQTALHLLRGGQVDVALVFRYLRDGAPIAAAEEDEEGTRARLLLDEPVHLVSQAAGGVSQAAGGVSHAAGGGGHGAGGISQAAGGAGQAAGGAGQGAGTEPAAAAKPGLAAYAGHRWIAGCERCRAHLLWQCELAGFTPVIAFTTDDVLVAQALAAAGLGVAMLPDLALRAARHPAVRTEPLAGARRQVLAFTYGEPPDPPAVERLLDALTRAASPARPVGPDRPPARVKKPR